MKVFFDLNGNLPIFLKMSDIYPECSDWLGLGDNKISEICNVVDDKFPYKNIAKLIIKKFNDCNAKIIRPRKGVKAKFNLNLEKLQALYNNLHT